MSWWLRLLIEMLWSTFGAIRDRVESSDRSCDHRYFPVLSRVLGISHILALSCFVGCGPKILEGQILKSDLGLPNKDSIPISTPLPIDGEWEMVHGLSRFGSSFRSFVQIDRGRIYFVSGPIQEGSVIVKGLTHVRRTRYIGTRIIGQGNFLGYRPAPKEAKTEIEVVANDELREHIDIDPARKSIWTDPLVLDYTYKLIKSNTPQKLNRETSIRPLIPSEFPAYVCHANANQLLLFIHGWSGDTANTWRDFPALACADPSLRTAAVLSLDYPTFIMRHNLTIEQTAHWIDERLLANGLDRFTRVAIIAHSIGGLVAREMILQLNGNPIVAKTHFGLLVELGTPHEGTYNYVELFTDLGLSGADVVAQVQPRSQFLQTLATHWDALSSRPRTYCFSSPQDMVVSRDSAHGQCDSRSLYPDVDHRGLAKPESADDDRYKIPMMYVKGFLRR